MTKKTIEIDDTLQETEDGVKEEIKDKFLEWLNDNPEETDFDAFDSFISDDGTLHEIVDGSVPIYYSEIDGLYYLYGDDFEEAYENAGIGNGGEDNHKQVAIYCYLEEKAYDYLRELKDAFEEWDRETTTKEDFIKSLE